MIADRNLNVDLLVELMEGEAKTFFLPQCTKQGWTVREYAEKLASRGTIAYDLIDGKISGFVIGYTSDPKYSTSFITQVYVRQKYRGHHIASNLMREYEAFCRNKSLNGIWLTTQVDNYIAQNFYFGLGFVIDSFADNSKILYKLSKKIL